MDNPALREKIERKAAGASWIESRGIDKYNAWVGKHLHDLASDLVHRHGRIRALDIGAGVGKALGHLSALFGNEIETHGIGLDQRYPIEIDFSTDKFLRRLREKGWKIETPNPPKLVEGRAERLPYPDNHFHLIMSVRGGLWYLPYFDGRGARLPRPSVDRFITGLREVARTLAPGGEAVIHAPLFASAEESSKIAKELEKQTVKHERTFHGRIIPRGGIPSKVQSVFVQLTKGTSSAQRKEELVRKVAEEATKRGLEVTPEQLSKGEVEFWSVYHLRK